MAHIANKAEPALPDAASSRCGQPADHLDDNARPRQESTQTTAVISDVAALTVRAMCDLGGTSCACLLLFQ